MEQSLPRAHTRADWDVRIGLAIACVIAVFVLNARFVLVDFTHGIGLLDSGWFAWIMASGDPWLTNPRAIDGLSYFNYHLTPYLSAISVLVHALGIDRFLAFAIHQGVVFALLAAGLCALVLTTWRGRRSAVLLAAVMIVALLGDVTLQMASFPHPEPIIVAFCLLGCACWLTSHRNWGALLFGLACLVREDGGLYAGAFLFALAVLRPLTRRTLTSHEALLGAAMVVVSLLMFLVKAEFFPGFSAFAFNYSGKNWDHLTLENLQDRLITFITNPRALAAILPGLLLGVLVSWRYFVFPLLMAPLILAQLLAARHFLWEFRLYYAMPFLVIWSGLVVVAAYRAREATMRLIEPIVLLASAILGSAPLLFVLLPSSSFPVMGAAIAWPIENLAGLSRTADDMTRDKADVCVSSSVAALAPDSFAPEQVLDPDFNVERCKTVLLYDFDPHYRSLSWHLVYWHREPRVLGRFERYDSPAG